MTILRCMAALAFVFALPLTQTPVAAAKSAKSKLTFYAAEGKPGACGPGCSEWIAVDGKIDPEAGKRFSEFLRSLPNPRLPVIFNSPGGRILASEAIGDLLRKNGMAAAVEKTVRVSKRARQRPQYRIVFRGARCNSACVSSFIGATRRDVAPGARIGVHASRPLEPSKLELVKEQERHYVVRMGIDAALIDTASKSLSIRNLSRNELYRYGILLSKEPFDTPWRFIKRRIHSFVVKSLTRMDEAAHHTTYIEFRCKKRGDVHLSIQRDLSDRELGSRSIMMLSWSGGRLWGGQSYLRSAGTRRHVDSGFVKLDYLLEAATDRSLALREIFAKKGQIRWIRDAQISTDGLYDALVPMLTWCGNVLPERRSGATGLGALGLLGWRRKRKPQATLAA